VINGNVELNAEGEIAFNQWMQLEKRFPTSDFSAFVVMPNHVHGIIVLEGGEEQPQKNNHSSLGVIVRAYKAAVTFRINAMYGNNVSPVWQRNYYDEIIRNERQHENVWKYIYNNPLSWEDDKLHLSIR
jgi:REP element-mobilizing transposase RayT